MPPRSVTLPLDTEDGANTGEDGAKTGQDLAETGQDGANTGEEGAKTGQDLAETGQDGAETGQDGAETGEAEGAEKDGSLEMFKGEKLFCQILTCYIYGYIQNPNGIH